MRTFVTARPPAASGPGNPHRILVNSRPQPPSNTTGAEKSGYISSIIGKFPDESSIALVSSRIAFWLFVML